MNATKNTYRITQRMDTYATLVVEADTPAEALAIADGDEDAALSWEYDTDFHSATAMTWDLIEAGAPYEDLTGALFTDPYLGVDVTWEVTGNFDGDEWHAVVVDGATEDVVGQEDIYAGDHIKNFRV